MYSDLSLCDSFINAVDANSTLKIGNEELLHLFIDSLGEEIGLYKLYQIDSLQLGTKEYIKNKLVTPLLSKISEEVEKAKNTDSRDSEKRKKAGEYLMVNTKNPLEELRKVLGLSDAQYGLVADKVGQTILQCGIDYFNGSDDNDAIFKALELQRYARSVVVGHIAKQRCDENIRILEKNAENTPPSKVVEEFNAINKLLEEASEQPDEICYSIELLNSTKPYLQSIKSKLGATNTHYLKISTLVVSVALHKLVQVVNEAQKEPETFLGNSDPFGLGAGFRSNYYNLTGQRYTSAEVIQRTTEAVAEAWPAIFLMDGFDIEPSFKEHYNKNRSTLRSLCERFGIQYKTKEELQKEKKDKTKKVLCIIVGIVLIESIWAIIGHDEIGNALLVSLGAWTLFPINILALMGFLKLCERIFKIEI